MTNHNERSSKQRLEEYIRDGYTVFPKVFNQEQIESWKDRYLEIVSSQRLEGDEPQYWLGSVVESQPALMLPAVSNPTLLDFAERVMGPFVQLDNLTFMGFPPDPGAKNHISGWHRDRWSGVPTDGPYAKPLSCNAIAYLSDMTDKYGPLRVLPGSHRQSKVIPKKDQHKPQEGEKLIYTNAGDVIFTHGGLLHSGTANTSEDMLYFLSIFYNYSGLRTTDNHSGPNVQRIIAKAREENDLRTMRLFGVDDQVVTRANYGYNIPEEEMWDQWITEDRAKLKKSN